MGFGDVSEIFVWHCLTFRSMWELIAHGPIERGKSGVGQTLTIQNIGAHGTRIAHEQVIRQVGEFLWISHPDAPVAENLRLAHIVRGVVLADSVVHALNM